MAQDDIVPNGQGRSHPTPPVFIQPGVDHAIVFDHDAIPDPDGGQIGIDHGSGMDDGQFTNLHISAD
jgi:hypothetical protein